MAAFCRTYTSQASARDTAEALSHRVPDDDLWLLTGSPLHDIRREPVGGFAGAIGPHARVGTYGNLVRLRRQAAGGFAGDPDRRRQGSFADSDRVVITTVRDGSRRSRIAGHLEVRRLLRDAGMNHAAERLIDELTRGHTAVVARRPNARPDEVWSPLEHLGHAAWSGGVAWRPLARPGSTGPRRMAYRDPEPPHWTGGRTARAHLRSALIELAVDTDGDVALTGARR